MESVLDRMKRENADKKIADFMVKEVCTDQVTGEKYGWGRVLDYIGVGWENAPDTDCVGQISMWEES